LEFLKDLLVHAPLRATFGPFTLDTTTRRLSRTGRPIPLSPKAFDALALLVAERPRVIDRATFRAHLWPGVHVSDGNLNVIVAEIRRALGESAREAALVRTVDRVGYAFDAIVVEHPAGAEGGTLSAKLPSTGHRSARYAVVWSGGRAVVGFGIFLLGRHPSCDVWVDVEGVSRRHARLRINSESEVSVEDLGSTNGTFVAGSQIHGVAVVPSGGTIQLGPVDVAIQAIVDRPTKPVRRA
jgi:DNA-binding winged helix-turn-helix (wHTH) protein